MVETVPVESSKPDELFTSCSQLSKHGYEGYECTHPSRCHKGYIVSDVIDGIVSAKSKTSNLRSTELVASNYECPQVVPSSENDYYEDYDYYITDYSVRKKRYTGYEQDGEKFICCRDSNFLGKGT